MPLPAPDNVCQTLDRAIASVLDFRALTQLAGCSLARIPRPYTGLPWRSDVRLDFNGSQGDLGRPSLGSPAVRCWNADDRRERAREGILGEFRARASTARSVADLGFEARGISAQRAIPRYPEFLKRGLGRSPQDLGACPAWALPVVVASSM